MAEKLSADSLVDELEDFIYSNVLNPLENINDMFIATGEGVQWDLDHHSNILRSLLEGAHSLADERFRDIRARLKAQPKEAAA
jgi:hypothetical protein